MPDWTKLAAHRPLDPTDATYVERPDSGPRIAEWIAAGRSPLLVAGPVGIGKSTELAHAAGVIESKGLRGILVRLDRATNMRSLDPDRFFDLLARQVAIWAKANMPFGLSPTVETLGDPRVGHLAFKNQSKSDVALGVVREVARRTESNKPVILIDGLEKIPETAAPEIFEAMASLVDLAHFVVVVPWHAAFGPGAATVISPSEKLIVVSPLDTTQAGAAGDTFLRIMALRRLGLSSPAEQVPEKFMDPESGVLRLASLFSGGIPRTFLQLLADAASYARLERSNEWPSDVDVKRAITDMRESFRRLLLPGDAAALNASRDTDGRELDLDRKLRLLSHGMLLQRVDEGRAIFKLHPIVEMAIEGDFFLV